MDSFISLSLLAISKADMNIPQTHVFNFSEDYSSPFFEESGLGMAVEQNLMDDGSGLQSLTSAVTDECCNKIKISFSNALINATLGHFLVLIVTNDLLNI